MVDVFLLKRGIDVHPNELGPEPRIEQWHRHHRLIDAIGNAVAANETILRSAPIATRRRGSFRRRRDPSARAAKFLAKAALFVGNNSGPKHLAAALGVPTWASIRAPSTRANGVPSAPMPLRSDETWFAAPATCRTPTIAGAAWHA
jgi:hypothetical protein